MDDKFKLNLKEFEKLSQRMEKIFHDLISQNSPFMKLSDKGWMPSIDIYETNHEVIVLVELAGVQKKDINVSLDDNTLSINGIRSNCISDKMEKLHQMEIDFGKFERAIHIPVQVQEEGISASFDDGFLLIRLPKLKRTSSRAITINND